MSTRDKILNAAEHVVKSEGVKSLSFESIAQAAGVSRGGVLYHFPSKEALIEAMLQRLVTRFEQILQTEMKSDNEPGRFARAFARASLNMDKDTIAVFAPIIAAVAYEPSLLKSFSEAQQLWKQKMREDLDPTVADIIQLTSFALWVNKILSTTHMSFADQQRIVAYLEKMTR